MDELKKLYLVSTIGCGEYYIIAKSFDSASVFVEKMLDDYNYGFSDDRRVDSIKIISEESKYCGENEYKPVGDKTRKLIILGE